jgi:hypothetical protein
MTIRIHASWLRHQHNDLDLDPAYEGAHGLPLLRMTFDWHGNDPRKMRNMNKRRTDIGRALNGSGLGSENKGTRFGITGCQSTHNVGGAVMGSDPSTSIASGPVSQCVDQQRKRRSEMSAVRVVEVVARVGRTPIGKHADETPVGDVGPHSVLGYICQAEPGHCRVEHRGGSVEHELSLDPHPDFAASPFELPGIEPAMGWQAQVDARVRCQVPRRLGP